MTTASIVTHKTPAKQLNKALKCLLKSSMDKVFIIDNSPTDDLERCLPSDEKIEYLHVSNNGFGAGHNVAIKKAFELEARYHLVMNADVWWEDSVIEKMTAFLDVSPEVGIISPKIFYPDGDLQYSCRMLPTPLDLFAKRFLPAKISRKNNRRYMLAGHDHDYDLNVPYLLGSFLLFRMEALKDTGLFDERFFMYPEDIDITRRIHEKWQTLYWPHVSIVHEHQAASRKNFKMLAIHLVNMIKYFNKWGWVFDKGRKEFNNDLKRNIKQLKPGKLQKGRG